MTRIAATWLADPALRAVTGMLTGAGHRALLVGGCVRNALLDQPISDIDIATDALPDRVGELAARAGLKPVPTGIDHGTVTVISGGRPFEVTTFRRDVETDGRRAVVAFTDRLQDDAERRDFTMNALYAQPDGTVLDPVDGLPDLVARRLRFVGRPEDRIREDYLRILRFFRFHAWYGAPGAADRDGLRACARLAGGLVQISKERIGAEMKKLLAAPDPAEAVALMRDADVLARVLPGTSGDLGDLLTVEAEQGVSPAWPRRLAFLRADDPADALRLSRAEAKTQAALREALNAEWSLAEAGYRLPDLAEDYALIRAARGQALPTDWRAQLRHAAGAALPVSAADLAPGLQGSGLGRGLKAAEAAWIASRFAAGKDKLIALARAAGAGQG